MTNGDSSAPPTEALRQGIGRGAFAATVVVVAIVAAGSGVFVGKALYGGAAGSTASHFLVVGTNIPFPPFEDYNYTNGTYFGFDIDFSNLIAHQLGRTLVIDNYADFGALLTAVGVGVVDMAASAITESGSVGTARNATMAFSIPYYDANQAVLVRSASSLSCPVSGCTASNLSTLKVGVQSGTSSQTWAQAYLVPNESAGGNVTAYTTVDLEVAALSASSLDAVIIDQGPANAIAAGSSGALKVAGTIFTNELYGFAVAHGDPQHLLPVINSVISNSMTNGTYQALITKWFG